MPIRSMFSYLLAVLLCLTGAAAPGFADESDLTLFRTQYRGAIGSRIDRCGLCHAETAPRLNPYGTDYRASNGSFLALENLDSDRDGYSNLAEIIALTFPGNADDRPNQEPDPCPGDCNVDSAVTVDEILAIVNVALGTTGVDACHAADVDQNGAVTIDELLTAVTVALNVCPG